MVASHRPRASRVASLRSGAKSLAAAPESFQWPTVLSAEQVIALKQMLADLMHPDDVQPFLQGIVEPKSEWIESLAAQRSAEMPTPGDLDDTTRRLRALFGDISTKPPE